jgi:hypothetical protein
MISQTTVTAAAAVYLIAGAASFIQFLLHARRIVLGVECQLRFGELQASLRSQKSV